MDIELHPAVSLSERTFNVLVSPAKMVEYVAQAPRQASRR